MESGGVVGDFVSPESTVTSLLSSSGYLRSSLLAPEHNTTFRYRDKDYDSATAALDAYITDFERSHENSVSTGSLVLPHSPPSTLSRPRVSTLRNKDVLRERLTDRELDFLNLPVSSLHHRGNRDRLSMTTDELLSVPYDGSMPVTHTSAFIQGLLSQSGTSQPRSSCSRPAHTTWDGLRNSIGVPQLNHQHLHSTRMSRSSRCRERPGAAMLNPHLDISSVSCSRQSAHRAAGREWAEPSSSLHLPRWFTSHKNDMDCSGITSVPDVKYPAWIQRCDLSEPPPPSESEPWDDHGVLPPAAPRGGAPSWVAELEDEDDPDQAPAPVDSQQTLRDLRLQFAEQISLLAAERTSSDVMETLFRDNTVETLIQKADRVLNRLSQSSGEADGPADPVSPVNTEELLRCSSSHCRPSTWDSAAAAGGTIEALLGRGAQAPSSSLRGNGIFEHPGPVEALKQMLFRLQAVEAQLQHQQAPAAPTLPERLQTDRLQTDRLQTDRLQTDRLQTDRAPVKQRPEGEVELESFPGGPSLQRAMHHLSRLKVLVEEPREKRTEEEDKEKDEDEGRYSSSSAEGITVLTLSRTPPEATPLITGNSG